MTWPGTCASVHLLSSGSAPISRSRLAGPRWGAWAQVLVQQSKNSQASRLCRACAPASANAARTRSSLTPRVSRTQLGVDIGGSR